MAQDDVKIKVTVDSKNAEKNLKDLDKDLDTTKKSAGKLSLALNSIGDSAKKFGPALASAAKSAVVGISALVAGLGASIAVFREQEQAEIRTRKTIEATGKAAGLSAEEIFKMASELQNVTTYGDEAIIGGQNLLLTFRNIGKDVFPRATEAMLDMSTAMGTDLKSSAIQLGKALNDPTAGMAALTRVGITFSDEQKNLIKSLQKTGDTAGAQAVILKELENQFGGVSRAATEGTGGLIQLKNQLGDVQEEIGRASLPLFLKLGEAVRVAAVYWNEFFFGAKEGTKDSAALAKEIKTLDSEIDSLAGKIKTVKETGGESLFGGMVKSFKAAVQGINSSDALEFQSGASPKIDESLEQLEKKQVESLERLAFLRRQYAAVEKQEKAQKKLDDLAGLEEVGNKEQEALIAGSAERIKILQDSKIAEKDIEALDREGKIEALNENLMLEAELKEEAKIKELIDQQKFVSAREAIDSNATKKKLKNLEKEQKEEQKIAVNQAKFEAQMATQKVQLLANTQQLIETLNTNNNRTAFFAAKALAAAQIVMSGLTASALALSAPPMGLGPVAGAPLSAMVWANTGLRLATLAATTVQGMAKGGMVEGGIAGVDSVPMVAQREEVVVPAKTSFQDLVDAGRSFTEGGEGGGVMQVIIGFTDDAFEIIEEKILERRSLGVGLI